MSLYPSLCHLYCPKNNLWTFLLLVFVFYSISKIISYLTFIFLQLPIIPFNVFHISPSHLWLCEFSVDSTFFLLVFYHFNYFISLVFVTFPKVSVFSWKLYWWVKDLICCIKPLRLEICGWVTQDNWIYPISQHFLERYWPKVKAIILVFGPSVYALFKTSLFSPLFY